MVEPISSARITGAHVPSDMSAGTSAAVATSAVTLAPTSRPRDASRPTGTDIIAASSQSQQQLQNAVMAAIAGSPDALVAYMTIQVRNSQSSSQQGLARSSGVAAQAAATQRERAEQQAVEAAKSATGFLGLGDTFGWIAKIAGIVAAACVSVATGGLAAGALVAVGAALLMCGDDVAKKLGEAGVIPADLVDTVSAALKITGAIMMGGGVLGIVTGIAAAALTSYAGDISKGLADAGVIGRDAVPWMTIGISLAGAVAGGVGTLAQAGGTATRAVNATADAVLRASTTGAQITEGSATAVADGLRVAGGVENHEASERNADARVQGARVDSAQTEQAAASDEVAVIVKGIARLMGHVRDISEARNSAHQAAVNHRA